MEGGKLTPDEMKFYRGVFVTLDWLNNKQIPCNPQLKLLLQSSRLPVATLGQLWNLSYALATNNKRDWLTDRDLCIVLRLIAMAQAGQAPSYEGTRAEGLPLPKIDIMLLREAHKKAIEEGKVPAPGHAGQAPPPSPSAASSPPPAAPTRQPAGPPPPSPAATPAPATAASPPPAAAVVNPTPAVTSSPAPSPTPTPVSPGVVDWSMSEKQKLDYARSFEQLDPEKKGIIPALNAVGFLRKSKLPEEVLREIWKLSDIGRDGALDLHEFCIAMHLVLKARSNVPLPPTLPPVLLPGRSQAQVEAEEKAKKDAEEAQRVREQQAKEQQQRAEQQQKAEQEQREQQEKEAREKEQREKEQQAKQKQDEVKEQQAKQQQDTPAGGEQKGEEKATAAPSPAADQKAEGEQSPAPARSKFARGPAGEGGAPLAAATPSPAAAPRSRPREPPKEEDAKRNRSPAPRNRSPATRANVKPGEPTIGWDNTVKLDREEPLIPLSSPAKPSGEAMKAQPALRAWIEALLAEKIAPGLPLFDALKSGVRICKMLNVIDPNSILDISTQQFMRTQNVNSFLDALRKKGFKPNQLFLAEDLLEQRDMEAVYSTLIDLDAYAEQVGFEGVRLKR